MPPQGPEPPLPIPLPIPPEVIVDRTGPMDEGNPVSVFESTGRTHRAIIESLLPDGWDWAGKRTLDFGCGSGRVLRQFLPEAEGAEGAEFWGCDLDPPSVAWLRENLEPPFHFFSTDEEAAMPQADGTFDLIYAISVYTHFTDNWAGWMAEHHRVLADGGLMALSYLGPGMFESLTGEPWDEDRVGMNPLLHGFPWDQGGPIAFNSEWWIRAHWGRAFDILALNQIQGGEPHFAHGMVLLRKKPITITPEDLTRLEPDEPREIAALQHNVEQLRDDTLRLRAENARMRDWLTAAEGAASDNQRIREEIEASTSWRLTAPLRAAKARRR